MEPNVYLPPKNAEWNNPNTLSDKDDVSKYTKPMGNMDIINEAEINALDDLPVDEYGEYNHKDGEPRHPETLYLVPGNPRHRSDSLAR